MVLFVSSLLLLIFCLPVLTTIKSRVLKFPTTDLSISPYTFTSFCFMYDALLSGAYVFRNVMSF